MINIDKIFIAHYEPLVERKKILLEQLVKNKMQAEWVTDEPENFNFYEFSDDLWNKKVQQFNYGLSITPRKLKKSELSLAYKHIKIFNDITKNNIVTSLIMEDDVLLINNFSKNFNEYLKKTPKDWDFIFIGSGCDLRIPIEKRNSSKAYTKEHPASKCTDSFLVSIEAAHKICDTMKKITLPIDFELNYQMWFNKLKVYWWEPPIVMQGSQASLYESSVQ
jgi:GR25 family glycosyltransferase involved in LPS biosynthesis